MSLSPIALQDVQQIVGDVGAAEPADHGTNSNSGNGAGGTTTGGAPVVRSTRTTAHGGASTSAYAFVARSSTTWLSSPQATCVSASRIARSNLSMSGAVRCATGIPRF